MARRRRKVEAFGLSFLDCICCGFGAVLLIYVYLSADSAMAVMNRADDVTAEINRLDEEVIAGRRNLVVLRNALDETRSETASAEARARQIIAELESRREQVSTYDATSLAQRERIEKLKADVRALEEGLKRLEGGTADPGPPGQKMRSFRERGGDRRYITGIRMRGQRILILVDRSASMMHHDLITILRLRNSPERERREAAKWRRAVETASWLTTQLPPDGRYQIVAFNTNAQTLLPESAGKWHSVSDPQTLVRNIEALQRLTPQDGTNFARAFAEARKLAPAPDQIVLITDGFPTQGEQPPRGKYINAQAREALFEASIKSLPEKVPLDIVLLPLTGEVQAAHRFWKLAIAKRGALLIPSKDWP